MPKKSCAAVAALAALGLTLSPTAAHGGVAVVEEEQEAAAAAGGPCPLRDDTNVVFSIATGVGPGSRVWVEDFLWWWASANEGALRYQSLVEQDIQSCSLADFPNLRLYINPGGNAYNQLSALQKQGVENVKAFVNRDQAAKGTSSYAGFCAGAYMAAHDFIWESKYEGTDYYAFQVDPPFSFFPHTVEGSLIDLSDDQFGDQFGNQYRVVNVSNGHQMLYYGGSSFGFNGALPVHDPASSAYDPALEVVLYYSDFYGHLTYNLPAAWKYANTFLTSIHSEADNCTIFDCPPAGSIPTDRILQNRAWLATHLNNISGLNLRIPTVPLAPSFDTTPPHQAWPTPHCQRNSVAGRNAPASQVVLFCDDFDTDVDAGEVASGLWQWQRNQSNDFTSQPWNTTYIEAWKPGGKPGSGRGPEAHFGTAQSGNGWAVAVPMASKNQAVTITSHPIQLRPAVGDVTLSYYFKGNTGHHAKSDFSVFVDFNGLEQWQIIQKGQLNSPNTWQFAQHEVPFAASYTSVRVAFSCITSEAKADNFCGVDTVMLSTNVTKTKRGII